MRFLNNHTVNRVFLPLAIFFTGANLPAYAQTFGSGTTDGSFGSLSSVDPITFPDVDGVGTSQLNFSYPNTTPNFFKFDGTSFENIQPGDTFVLGTFSYRNGNGFQGFQGVPGSSVTYTSELTVSSSSSVTTPFDFNQSFTEGITLVVTPNAGVVNGVPTFFTPEQAADIFYFTDRPELGSFRVFESFLGGAADGIGTVEILGAFGSLDLVGFGNAIIGGFVNPTIDPIPDPNATVPEPSSVLGLLALSTLGAGSVLRRKHKYKSAIALTNDAQ